MVLSLVAEVFEVEQIGDERVQGRNIYNYPTPHINYEAATKKKGTLLWAERYLALTTRRLLIFRNPVMHQGSAAAMSWSHSLSQVQFL